MLPDVPESVACVTNVKGHSAPTPQAPWGAAQAPPELGALLRVLGGALLCFVGCQAQEPPITRARGKDTALCFIGKAPWTRAGVSLHVLRTPLGLASSLG